MNKGVNFYCLKMAQTFVFVILAVFVSTSQCFTQKMLERTDSDGVEWVGPIRKCRRGDDDVLDECVRQIAKDLTPLVGAGIKEIGLPPLDPYVLKKFKYETSLGPINITVLAKDIKISKLTNYNLIRFRTDSKNQIMHFVYEVPQLHLEGKYKLGGNVYFFPLTGSGPVQIDVFNLRAEGQIIGKLAMNSQNEEVIQVERVQVDKINLQDMNLFIRGLFNGNTLLSSVVHYIGKRYAAQVFEVIRPEISEQVSSVITHELLNPVLENLPYIVDYLPSRSV